MHYIYKALPDFHVRLSNLNAQALGFRRRGKLPGDFVTVISKIKPKLFASHFTWSLFRIPFFWSSEERLGSVCV